MRVGMGYDVHKLVENRKLILGGVAIPYEYGLLGHSDADVLVHAIMDALLGAAALRDIGRHFPDNDPAYEGADSIELLKKVGEMLEERMYLIENIDATVIAQKPKLLPYIDTMVKNVAEALHLEDDQVNIKATTEEGLGFYRKERGNFRTGDLLHFQGTRPDAGRPDRRRMQRLPGMRKRTQKNKREMRLHKAGRCGRLEEE